MSEFDHIEFDFFDEPETADVVGVRGRPPVPGRRRARGRPPSPPRSGEGSFAPVLRLGALTALVIVVAVTATTLLNAQLSTSKKDEYAAYLTRVHALAERSDQLGGQFSRAFLSARPNTSTLARDFEAEAQQQLQAYDQAQQIGPPGPLRQAQQHLLDAIELRATGLADLGATLAEVASLKPNASTLIARLTGQAQLLTTSDVVWQQLYRADVIQQIKAQQLTGLAVPQSRFVANVDLLGSRSFALLLQRLRAITRQAAPLLLKLGDHGAAVARWQRQLERWLKQAKPQTTLTVTSVFDQATQTATKTLQTAAAITADGIVGPTTRHALALQLAANG